MPCRATIRRLRGGFEKCCNVDRNMTWRRQTLRHGVCLCWTWQQGYLDAGLQDVVTTLVVGIFLILNVDIL